MDIYILVGLFVLSSIFMIKNFAIGATGDLIDFIIVDKDAPKKDLSQYTVIDIIEFYALIASILMLIKGFSYIEQIAALHPYYQSYWIKTFLKGYILFFVFLGLIKK